MRHVRGLRNQSGFIECLYEDITRLDAIDDQAKLGLRRGHNSGAEHVRHLIRTVAYLTFRDTAQHERRHNRSLVSRFSVAVTLAKIIKTLEK